MRSRIPSVVVALVLQFATIVSSGRAAAQHPPMPPGMTHEEHLRQIEKDNELKRRGAAAMSFDQDATTHHFRLTRSGGRIEVSVNDPSDAATLKQVREHLKTIAAAFAQGTFDKPFATHGEIPPGVPTLQRRNNAVDYRYEDLPAGGAVAIASRDRRAVAAVHAFLRYQIREHGTGDALTIARSSSRNLRP